MIVRGLLIGQSGLLIELLSTFMADGKPLSTGTIMAIRERAAAIKHTGKHTGLI